MSVFIAHIILVVSVGGMLLLVARKIPVLVTLPEVAVKKSPRTKNKFFVKIENSATVLQQKFHKYNKSTTYTVEHKIRSFWISYLPKTLIFNHFLIQLRKSCKRLKKNDFFKDKVYKQEEFDRESDYWKKIRKEKTRK